MQINTAPDHAARGRAALGDLFDGMIAELSHEYHADAAAAALRARFPELPEPMLGEMGLGIASASM